MKSPLYDQTEIDTVRNYFKNDFLADDVVRPLNTYLVNTIFLEFAPVKSVFEFGCGQGKNLQLLKCMCMANNQPIDKVMGVDISQKAVEEGYHKGRGKTEDFIMIYDDETALMLMRPKTYDVCFTCSVLDHIPDRFTVNYIIRQLKRIAKKGVVLCETLADDPEHYYYPHNYEAMGFTKIPNYEYHSIDGDSNTYYIYMAWKRKRKPKK